MLGPRLRGGIRCVKRAKARLDAFGWLGREGSNLPMLESKSSALPLGDAPKLWSGRDHIEGVAGFQRGENAKKRPANNPESLCFWSVAAPGGHRYKGAPARQAQSPSDLSESSSAW